jgi:SAM-dependent methyltransferase
MVHGMESSPASRQRKSFIAEHYALDWRRLAPKYGITLYHQQMFSLLSQLKENVNASRVLDCAAGSGYPFALEFSRRGWELFALDLSPILARSQVEASEAERIPARCTVGDSEGLPFKDSAFGLTYCLQATWYFPDLTEALRDMGRVTAQGGVLVFDIMNVFNPATIFWHSVGRLLSTLRFVRVSVFGGPKTHHVSIEKASSPLVVEKALLNFGWNFRRLIPSAIASLSPNRGRVRSRFYLI